MDRFRQEAKDLQAKHNNLLDARRTTEAQLRRELQIAHCSAISASQAADVLQGKCELLEKQLSSLRELPARLEAASKRSVGADATKVAYAAPESEVDMRASITARQDGLVRNCA